MNITQLYSMDITLVLNEAFTWIGTPYRPRTSIKHVGVDCFQFIKACYETIGIEFPDDNTYDILDLNNNLIKYFDNHKQVSRTKQLTPGTLVIINMMHFPKHCAIYVGDEYIIHASTMRGVEKVLITPFKKTIHSMYNPKV
jgi:cell wall-associated NlpC family hydrolase